nr:MAG: hypothetical protein [Molluscum contagiosum virus]
MAHALESKSIFRRAHVSMSEKRGRSPCAVKLSMTMSDLYAGFVLCTQETRMVVGMVDAKRTAVRRVFCGIATIAMLLT